MAKITVEKKQARVTIPREIMELMNWNKDTEIYFIPYLVNASDPLTHKTSILMKEKEK